MIKYTLKGNKLITTKIYERELSSLQINILKELLNTGKYITKNMKDDVEELSLRDLRLAGLIETIPAKRETHVLYKDVEKQLKGLL